MKKEVKKKENYLPTIEHLIEELMEKKGIESLEKALDLMVEYEKIKSLNYIADKLDEVNNTLSDFRI